MNPSRLVFREIAHRKLNFLLGAVCVALTVFITFGAMALLKAHDLETRAILADHDTRTEAILAQLESDTSQNMDQLEDAIRKSMKGLGFNIFIYPEGQEMAEVYAQGFASKTMPEEYVNKLANSKIVTVNHLLPRLTRKIKWPEQERTVVLIGVRGEVPLAHRDPKKPLIDPVPEGKLVVGYELHKGLDLKPGDTVKLMGKEFTVQKCHKERGTVDDITIWMNLGECQQILDQEGRINSILALECNCATLDRLGEIRAEIGKILPGTKIIEKGSKALARAEARVKAGATARKQMIETGRNREQQRANKSARLASLQGSRERMASILVPLIAILCLAIVGILSFTNVRDRQAEIGIFRAMGVTGGLILKVFLARAFFLGLLGAVIGLIFLNLGGSGFQEKYLHGYALSLLLDSRQLAVALITVPLLACVAAWLPSLHASQRDPAEILRHE
ncbi:MAG: ABC transporter permease [Opitutae bacterium]|nr:ABC transporter permease [Opitutae bacterium]